MNTHKTPAQLRREHEARTGMRANMRALGWGCMKSSERSGKATVFSQRDAQADWIIRTTHGGKWRVTKLVPGVRWSREQKVVSPTFDGPVAAALWLKVEKANGTVRFVES